MPSLRLPPRRVGVVARHRGGDRGAVGAQVLLVYDALVVHDEARHARDTIARGPRDDGESAEQLVAHHVLIRSAGRILALRGEEFVVVAVISLWLLRGFLHVLAVAFLRGDGDERSERALRLARFV